MIGAVVVAAAFAARDWQRASIFGRIAILAVGSGAIVTIGAAMWAVLAADDVDIPLGVAATVTPIRAAARVALATIAGGFVVGVARGLGPAAMRASERSRKEPGARRDGPLWRFLELFADEVLPWRSDARREAAEAERARLAADLHAHVLPDLRRAAAVAESAGLPTEVQVDLRRALEDVEQLMHERQSIVLEQFGLVAALEWLAERAEERSALRVELEIVGAVPDGPTAIDRRVARAAYRIALLGLDNVVRHAGATTATLRLSGDAGALRLTVADDGATPAFAGSGGRGIPDMRTAAAESGGSVAFVAGTGARIEAIWPLARGARNHAPAPAPIADRPEAPAP
jgi:signal transduction histidine kinase